MEKKFYTIGYEKAAVDDLIATLKLHDIKRLIDVRELPLSRKKVFRKIRCGWRLKSGILNMCI